MGKVLNIQKLIVEIKDNTIDAAVLLYQVNENGSISKTRSVSVKSALSGPDVNQIIADAKVSAESSEGI